MSILETPPEAAPANTGQAARVGLRVLALSLGVFVLWAAFAPLDEGVPAAGVVAIDTKRKAVQHLSGGIVKEVLVREGDMVKEGQILIQLDAAMAKANYEAVRQRYLGLRASQGRLMAEQTTAPKIDFHADLMAAAQDPLIAVQMQTQLQLLASRRAALQADLQSIQENMAGQRAMLQANKTMLSSRQTQRALLQEELTNTRDLVKDGYAPRNRQLELERQSAELSALIAELSGNIQRTQSALAELQQRAQSRQQEYRKEVETQLADTTREVQSDAEKFIAAKADLERTGIAAPTAGQVVGLAMQTVGGVVQPGQKIMDIVPVGEALLLEARIEPHLIDKVRSGLPTDVRFSAFAHSPQLVVGAQVVSVSRDALTDPQTGAGFYLARIQVTPQGMKTLGTHQMQPGMPAEVVIKTGERSMLTYLLNPLTKRLAASMKEE